jgi:hypothetical protein
MFFISTAVACRLTLDRRPILICTQAMTLLLSRLDMQVHLAEHQNPAASVELFVLADLQLILREISRICCQSVFEKREQCKIAFLRSTIPKIIVIFTESKLT